MQQLATPPPSKPKELDQQKTDFTAEGAPAPDGVVSGTLPEKPNADQGAAPSDLETNRPKAKP